MFAPVVIHVSRAARDRDALPTVTYIVGVPTGDEDDIDDPENHTMLLSDVIVFDVWGAETKRFDHYNVPATSHGTWERYTVGATDGEAAWVLSQWADIVMREAHQAVRDARDALDVAEHDLARLGGAAALIPACAD